MKKKKKINHRDTESTEKTKIENVVITNLLFDIGHF
jgi:hypothetical protein